MSEYLCAPLVCDTPFGELTVNSVNLHTPAWCLFAPLNKLYTQRTKRGSNDKLPYVEGSIGNKPLLDEGRHDLPIIVVGSVDSDGTPYTDEWFGFATNRDYLTAQLVDADGDPITGAVTASLDPMTGGPPITGDVQVLAFDPSGEPDMPAAVFTLSILVLPGKFA